MFIVWDIKRNGPLRTNNSSPKLYKRLVDAKAVVSKYTSEEYINYKFRYNIHYDKDIKLKIYEIDLLTIKKKEVK